METENYQIDGKKETGLQQTPSSLTGNNLSDGASSIPGLSSGRYPGRLWKNGCRRMREIGRKDKIKNP